MCSTLGDQPPGQDIDDDIYMITGVQDEQVDIVLDVQATGAGRATLMIVDMVMGQTTLFDIDQSLLPNDLSVQLPADGDYRIAVIEQPPIQIGPGPIFSGDYCLTVDSTLGAAATLSPTSTIEPLVYEGSGRPEDGASGPRPKQAARKTKAGRGSAPRR